MDDPYSSSFVGQTKNEEEEERRIYLVTDGFKSADTKRTFKHFLKNTIKNDDL
jgi:hypothetical protein